MQADLLNYSPSQYAVNTIIAISSSLLLFFWTLLWSLCRLYIYPSHVPPRGCRRVGLPLGQSNLRDEFDPIYSQGVPANNTDAEGRPAWRVKALFAYPIKSCASIELDTADVVPTGFALDRQFCFAEDTQKDPSSALVQNQTQNHGQATASSWIARTLRDRNFNRMALIRPEIWVPDPTAKDYSPDLDEVKSQGVMVVYYPRISSGSNILQSALLKLSIALRFIPREASFHVPFFPPPDRISAYPNVPVKIWKDNPISYDYSHHIPDSLHRFLSASPQVSSSSPSPPRRLTLFRVNPSHHRQIFRCAPRKETLGFQPKTGFTDAYPLHLLTLSSIQDVGARCAAALPRLSARRFRANVLIQGPAAFAEDDWKKILIRPRTASSSSSSFSSSLSSSKAQSKDILIHTVCRTVRCRLPNVDPDTGERHPSEPDRTLKSYRRIDQGDLTNACLGMQGVPSVEEFRICVGDEISVIETGEHFYIKMLAPGEEVPGV